VVTKGGEQNGDSKKGSCKKGSSGEESRREETCKEEIRIEIRSKTEFREYPEYSLENTSGWVKLWVFPLLFYLGVV